jgi:quercetin dioxygenase-like cupin family protein
VLEPRTAILQFVLSRVRVATNVCTRQVAEHGYILPTRTVPDYNYIWVTRGTVVWVVEDVEYALRPGDLILVPPGVVHRGYSRTSRMTLGSIHVMPTLAGGQDVFEILKPAVFRTLPRDRGCWSTSTRRRLSGIGTTLPTPTGRWNRGAG